MVAYGKLAGLPSVHFVMAWKRVDFPTLASPTWKAISFTVHRLRLDALHTMPLFKLFPGLPRWIFSSLTAFLGGIFDLRLA